MLDNKGRRKQYSRRGFNNDDDANNTTNTNNALVRVKDSEIRTPKRGEIADVLYLSGLSGGSETR
jgi:hypothetical protein